MIRFVSVIFMCLLAFNVEPAETTYHCRQYQVDIDYWQEQYRILNKRNKSLYKELMEVKMQVLEKGIKIPEALKGAEIITSKEKKQTNVTNNYYW